MENNDLRDYAGRQRGRRLRVFFRCATTGTEGHEIAEISDTISIHVGDATAAESPPRGGAWRIEVGMSPTDGLARTGFWPKGAPGGNWGYFGAESAGMRLTSSRASPAATVRTIHSFFSGEKMMRSTFPV